MSTNTVHSLGIKKVYREAPLPVTLVLPEDAAMPSVATIRVFYNDIIQDAINVPVTILSNTISWTFTVGQLRDMVKKKAFFDISFDGIPKAGDALTPTLTAEIPSGEPLIINIDGIGNTRVVFTGDYADIQNQVNKVTSAAESAEIAMQVAITAALEAKDYSLEVKAINDAGIIQPGVYATEVLGRAAVANGQAFKVQGSGDVAAYEYRRIDAVTVSTLIATYPSSAAVADLPATKYKADLLFEALTVDTDGNLYFTDALGFIGMVLSKLGVLGVNAVESLTAIINHLTTLSLDLGDVVCESNTEYPLVFCDENGWILCGFNKDGSLIGVDSISGDTDRVYGKLGDMNHFMTYGQSLSVDQWGGADVETGTTPYVYTFHKGPLMYLHDADATKYDSLDLISSGMTTPAMGRMIKQSIIDSGYTINGTDHVYDTLVSAPGTPAYSIAQLSKGTVPYNRLIAGVTNGMSLSNTSGKTYNVGGIFWMQGEFNLDTSALSYRAALLQLQKDLNTDIKAITGQKNDVIVLNYQMASEMFYSKASTIPLELTDIGLTEPHFYAGPPTYPYTHVDDIHLTGASYAKIGALAGYILKRIVVDGIEWKPVHPVRWTVQGKILEVEFSVPVEPLALDSTLVSNPGNYGFRLFNSSSSEQTISSVSVVRPNTIRIVGAANITAGMTLTYGIDNGTTGKSGPTQGPRGCLRDSQGNTIIYQPAGLNYALHNWAPRFKQLL